MSLEERWNRQLDSLRVEGRYRSLTPPAGVDFSSNDYLGFAGSNAPSVLAAEHEQALSRSGAASRLLRGHHPLWDDVEAAAARWHGAEAALFFNSGYVANEGLLATLLEPDDLVYSDQSNHASLIDGMRLTKTRRVIFRHNDLAHLETLLNEAATQRKPNQIFFIVTESLFGMDGDRAPLADLANLADRYHAHLIIDEAHATGCLGPNGSGLVDHFGLRHCVLATIHTGGKALGVPGAYICGSRLLKEVLVNRCRHLIFTTAMPPLVAAWWLDALARVRDAAPLRAQLHGNVRLFRATLTDLGVPSLGADYIAPILLGDDSRAVSIASSLQDAGFDIRAIRPPTVPLGASRLRVSIHADHSEQSLRAAATEIARNMQTH